MAHIDEAGKRATFRFVWLGPRGAGRGTNIRQLHTAFPGDARSRLKAVEIRGDRTLSFQLELPVEDWIVELRMAGLTGDIRSPGTMKKALVDADVVVFVAHAGRGKLITSKEAYREMIELLRARKLSDETPVPPGVIQVNHTDAEDAVDAEEAARIWQDSGWPIFTAQAKLGDGVRETVSSAFQVAYQDALAKHPALENSGLYLDAVADTLIAAMRKTS